MKIKPLSNRTITKSNRTLVEEYSDKELNARSFIIQDAVDEAIANITYFEIKNLIDRVGGRRSTVDKSSPCFVDRYGEVISVNDAVGTGGRAMHRDYAVKMVKELYKKLGFMETELDEQCIEDGWVDTEFLSDQLQSEMMEYGIFRINTGTNAVENRFYCVLPARVDCRLNDSQYDTLKDFLWLSEELGRHRIIVFLGDDYNDFYLRDDFGPDEVLKEIKSYYGGHTIVDSLNEDKEENNTMKFVLVEDINTEDDIEVDSEGNPLSTEQVEFFKDSVIRDKNGRLLVCYHGTDSDFDSFEHSFIGDDNKSGYGFYFTLGTPLEYEYKHPKSVYLNITKPLNQSKIDEVTQYGWELRERGLNQKDIISTISKKYGADGVVDKNRGCVVAYFPNQIKSITNKNPTNSNNINEADQLSMDIDGAVASQVQKDIEEKEHQLESAMYYHYKDSLAGYNGADVKVSPDGTATIVTHWNVDDMSEELEYDAVKLFDQFEFRETQPHRVNDLKKTITFYISLGYGGNLNKEELKKEFLTLLIKNGTSYYTDRGFILPDGSLVGNEKFGIGGAPHFRVDDMITRKMAITNGVDEDEIIDAFGLKNNSRGLVADLCGCIRVNGWNEDYIALPPNKPTKQQLDTLEEWIDNFFEIRGYNDYLYVTDFYGNNQKVYHSPEYEGKDIVDRIVRFYNTGNLYEEKQDSKETKQDFGEGKRGCKIKRKMLKGRK